MAEAGGKKFQLIVFDDDTAPPARNPVREYDVDLLEGPAPRSASSRCWRVEAELQTSAVPIAGASLAASIRTKHRWIFKLPQDEGPMAKAISKHMSRHTLTTADYSHQAATSDDQSA